MSKETDEREARRVSYYQKLVYNALLPFKSAIYAANKEGIEIGVCGELDTENLLRDMKRIAGITTPDAVVILERIKAKEREAIDAPKTGENDVKSLTEIAY